MGNRNTVTSQMIGEVHFASVLSSGRQGGTVQTVFATLKDVLIVPGLQSNLLSCSAIATDGNVSHFGKTGCSVMKDGIVKVQGQHVNEIYFLKARLVMPHDGAVRTLRYRHLPPCALNAVQVPVIWHQRLGHSSVGRIAKLNYVGAVRVLNLDVTETSSSLCDACRTGKHSRLTMHSRPKDIPIKIGEVIHSDVCGKMWAESSGVSLYFLTFIDECSRLITLIVMSHLSLKSPKRCLREGTTARSRTYAVIMVESPPPMRIT